MGWFLVIIGLLVMLESHSTTPGIWIGLGLVAIGAVVFAIRGDED